MPKVDGVRAFLAVKSLIPLSFKCIYSLVMKGLQREELGKPPPRVTSVSFLSFYTRMSFELNRNIIGRQNKHIC
jgi:hypothetical protein